MSYNLTLHTYGGMSIPLVEEGTREECRKKAAEEIREHRNEYEYPVSILDRGEDWELESDPDGMSMIGDHEGVLSIREHEIADESYDEDEDDSYCPECGYEWGSCRCDIEEDIDEDDFEDDDINTCDECGAHRACCICHKDNEHDHDDDDDDR